MRISNQLHFTAGGILQRVVEFSFFTGIQPHVVDAAIVKTGFQNFCSMLLDNLVNGVGESVCKL